jgi:hypothetical protein
MLVTKAEAARALNISPQAMTRAIREGRVKTKISAAGREMVELDGLRERYAATTQRKIGGADLGDTPPRKSGEPIPDYNESRARTEFLKAELLELERAEKERTLIPAAEVEAKWVELVTIARTKLMGMPSKAKQRMPDLSADDIAILEDIVRESLEELSGER